MDATQLEAARSRLAARRHAVLTRYRDTLERADEELDSREIEPEENAAELWDAQVLSSLSDGDARQLRDILAAMRRIEQGSYGECTDCGDAIDPDRLAVLPEAARCIECEDAATRVTR